MNTCFVCNGTRQHENRDLMHEIVIEDRIICFGLTCLNEILKQYVKDWEARDAAMTERMNRHEAENNQESIIDAYDLLTDLMYRQQRMTPAWRKLLHARHHVTHQLKARF